MSTYHYVNAVLAEPPLLYYWLLNELTGTVAVPTAGSNAGTYTGGVVLGQPSLLSEAIVCPSFDGSTGYVAIPTFNPAGSFTVEAWVKPTSLAHKNVIFSAVGATSADQALHLAMQTTGDLTLGYWADDLQTANHPISVGSVYHVAGTYDAGSDTSRLYNNGAQVLSGNQGPYSGSATPTCRIGGWSVVAADSLQGQTGHVAFYNAALDAPAIARHYRVGSGREGHPNYGALKRYSLNAGAPSSWSVAVPPRQTTLSQADLANNQILTADPGVQKLLHDLGMFTEVAV